MYCKENRTCEVQQIRYFKRGFLFHTEKVKPRERNNCGDPDGRACLLLEKHTYHGYKDYVERGDKAGFANRIPECDAVLLKARSREQHRTAKKAC